MNAFLCILSDNTLLHNTYYITMTCALTRVMSHEIFVVKQHIQDGEISDHQLFVLPYEDVTGFQVPTG